MQAPAKRQSLLELLEARENTSPASPAVLAAGREPMCHADLVAQVRSVGERLRSFGLGAGDRVAVALPDSAETAVMMVAATAHGVLVPVNPRATDEEVQRQLASVRARAVVVPGGSSAAAKAAERVGIAALELRPDARGPAGRFGLEPLTRPEFYATQPSEQSSGAALVIHTAGTTGFPKIVPLTQDNLLFAMLANCDVLGLTPLDRCLGVMPLCHIHGLGAVLCSLLSGGSIIVNRAFTPSAFFDSLARLAPTWYTAVPAIHQLVLERAAAHEAVVRAVAERKALRFVRSGSAPMPRGVPERLERLFNTCYVEACGATEASAYVLSNRPGYTRIGSVGMPIPGTGVRVIDASGRSLGSDMEGELVVSGPGVFAGYEDNPAANTAAFIDGFFRTGDLARCDPDGFFYITGRVKEQINRGGAKVSPYEVEDALLRHPDVVQAVAFAMPDPLLGDEVAAAIVVRDKAQPLTELALQRFVAPHLADHKVPRRIVFVDSVPTGPTGKVSRIGLADLLAVGGAADPETLATALRIEGHAGGSSNAPVTTTEQVLAAIWSEVVGRPVSDIDASFEALGVDSLQALQISLAIEKRLGRSLPLAALSSHRTIRSAAALLECDGWRLEPGAPVVLREGPRDRPTLFVLPASDEEVGSYRALAEHLPEEQRVVGLPLPGADGLEEPLDSVVAIAERFTLSILREQPQGPYLLCGHSFGALAAFEVARRLLSAGAMVQLLAMLDPPVAGQAPPLKAGRGGFSFLRRVLGASPKAAPRRPRRGPLDMSSAARDALQAACQAAHHHWRPEPMTFRLSLIRATVPESADSGTSDPALRWSTLAIAGVDVTTIAGEHGRLLETAKPTDIAAAIAALINA